MKDKQAELQNKWETVKQEKVKGQRTHYLTLGLGSGVEKNLVSKTNGANIDD